MLLGPPPLAERRGEHAEVAIGSAVALDQVADHHVLAREGLELRIDERRDGLVAERRGGVGQIGERGEPDRLAEGVEPLGGDPRELPPSLLLHAELGQHRDHARAATGRAPRLAGQHPDHRRELARAAPARDGC